MINRILNGNAPIIYGDGEQTRCFSDIDDVVNPMVNSIFLIKQRVKQLM